MRGEALQNTYRPVQLEHGLQTGSSRDELEAHRTNFHAKESIFEGNGESLKDDKIHVTRDESFKKDQFGKGIADGLIGGKTEEN